MVVASLAEADLPGEPTTYVYLHLSICARKMEVVPMRESVWDIEGPEGHWQVHMAMMKQATVPTAETSHL